MSDQPAFHIPQPCSESWAQMTPSADGRHCQRCDKVVIDFTRMEGAQAQRLLSHATRAGREVCGRCRIDHHGHVVLPPARPTARRPWRRHVLTNGLAVLFAFGATGCSVGSDAKPVVLGSPVPQEVVVGDGPAEAKAPSEPGHSIQLPQLELDVEVTQGDVQVFENPTITELDLPVIAIETEDEVVDQSQPIVMGEMAVAPVCQTAVMGGIRMVPPPQPQPPKPAGPTGDG